MWVPCPGLSVARDFHDRDSASDVGFPGFLLAQSFERFSEVTDGVRQWDAWGGADGQGDEPGGIEVARDFSDAVSDSVGPPA